MLNLPALILYNGDWSKYEEVLYAVFKRDFLNSQPILKKHKVFIIKEPKFKNKEATFWHITSKGKIESERTPDIRKCERIAWIKPIIESYPHQDVKAWLIKKGGTRVCLCYGNWEYLAVLRRIKKGFLLITAHPVEYNNTKRKLEKQYKDFKNTKTAY
ncbi:MAG: hypothetical protein COS76_03455 [Candidatus Portnoybacteria bacterium CG06_land_8_20_14_3_00_39_12]|uniref:Phage P1-related protein n=1 Tax=Candidatus Portnoybacteria bacterium CG06_land_8_20_14_3_00_39_12 TaxID=1974809 RepID=A0A2M7AWD2_9BACT|nr:MAG: hypothetical protein COS76_03455 [Candidatus Portnoybacteria bacterium CG06_land_8_20_14_3_00_39_12]